MSIDDVLPVLYFHDVGFFKMCILVFCLFGKWVNIALRRFPHNHGNSATEGNPKPGLCSTLISNEFKVSL